MGCKVIGLLFHLLQGVVAIGKGQAEAKRLKAIMQRLEKGDYVHAHAEGKQFVQEYPKSALGWFILGCTSLKLAEYRQAYESLDRSISIDPTNDKAHLLKGAALRQMGDYEGAKSSYLEALKVNPNNAKVYAALAVVEIHLGQYQKAV